MSCSLGDYGLFLTLIPSYSWLFLIKRCPSPQCFPYVTGQTGNNAQKRQHSHLGTGITRNVRNVHNPGYTGGNVTVLLRIINTRRYKNRWKRGTFTSPGCEKPHVLAGLGCIHRSPPVSNVGTGNTVLHSSGSMRGEVSAQRFQRRTQG